MASSNATVTWETVQPYAWVSGMRKTLHAYTAPSATCMSTPNIFAVRAARASLADRAFLGDCRRRIIASRTRITSELTRLKLRYAEPQGNFVFFDTGMPLARFAALMKERDILVGRRFAPYENWCRVTIGTEPEVAAFLRRRT